MFINGSRDELTCAIYIEIGLVEKRLIDAEATMIPDWSDVEWHSVDDTEDKTQISAPSVQHVESFVADACQYRDDIGLHTETNNPGYECYGKHARSHSHWRGAILDALPEQWLRNKRVA